MRGDSQDCWSWERKRIIYKKYLRLYDAEYYLLAFHGYDVEIEKENKAKQITTFQDVPTAHAFSLKDSPLYNNSAELLF